MKTFASDRCFGLVTQELQVNGIQQLGLSSAAITVTDGSLDKRYFKLKQAYPPPPGPIG